MPYHGWLILLTVLQFEYEKLFLSVEGVVPKYNNLNFGKMKIINNEGNFSALFIWITIKLAMWFWAWEQECCKSKISVRRIVLFSMYLTLHFHFVKLMFQCNCALSSKWKLQKLKIRKWGRLLTLNLDYSVLRFRITI